MKCQNESGCEGLLDNARSVPMRVGCASFENALVCPQCGRIHWQDGTPVLNRQEYRAFLKGGEIVNCDEKGVEVNHFPIGY